MLGGFKMKVYCGNCGAQGELPVGFTSGFCNQCGGSLYVPAEAVGTGKKKSKKKAIIAAIVGVTAAAAVAVFALAFMLPVFLLSPYQRAEMNFFKALTAQMPNVNEGLQYDFSVGYRPSRDINNLLRDSFGDDNFTLPDITLSGTSRSLGQRSVTEGTLTVGRDIIDAVWAVDGTEMMFGVPTITQYYLRYVADPDNFRRTNTELDIKQLERNMTNIAKAYFELADRIARVDKGATVSGGGITFTNTTSYEMTFMERDVLELLLFAMRELQNNKNLMDWLDDNVPTYGGRRFSREFDDMIRDLEREARNSRSNDVLFRMTVWVHRGQIVQRRLDRFMDNNDLEIEYRQLVNRTNAFYELRVEYETRWDSTRIIVSGNFTKSGGTWSGNGRATFATRYGSGNWDSQDVNIDVRNFRMVRDIFEGSITVSADWEDWWGDEQGFVVTLALDRNGRTQLAELTADITVDGDRYDLGRLTMSYSQATIKTLNMPSWSSNREVLIGGYDGRWEDLYRDLLEVEERYAENDNLIMEGFVYGLRSIVQDLFWNEWWNSEFNTWNSGWNSNPVWNDGGSAAHNDTLDSALFGAWETNNLAPRIYMEFYWDGEVYVSESINNSTRNWLYWEVMGGWLYLSEHADFRVDLAYYTYEISSNGRVLTLYSDDGEVLVLNKLW
jgi:hypothetical protein